MPVFFKQPPLLRRFFLAVLLGITAACVPGEPPQVLLQRAQDYHKQGNDAAAELELKNLLEQNPDHAQARVLLGTIYLEQQNSAAAEKQLLRAQRLGADKTDTVIPMAQTLLLQNAWGRVINDITVFGIEDDATRSRILTLRGYAYRWNNEPDRARESFITAHELNTRAAGPLAGLAQLELGQGNPEAARKYAGQAISIDPGNMEALIATGRLEGAQNDLVSAEATFRLAVEAPDSEISGARREIAQSLLVDTLMARGKKEEALKTTRDMLARHPSAPIANYLRASIAYDAGDLETAGKHVQTALHSAPAFDRALRLKASIDYASGNLEQANAALADYSSHHPEDTDSLKLLAATRMQMQQPGEALAILGPLLQGKDDDSELLSMAAQANFAEGNTREGIALIERAASKDPDNQQLKLQLATAKLKLGQTDEALDILQSLPENPGDIGLRERLIMVAYIRKGDLQSARNLLDTYLASAPENTDLLNLAGTMLAGSNRPDEARSYFEKSLSIEPDKPATLLELAQLEARENHPDTARQLLEKLIEKNPGNLKALDALAGLAEQRGDRQAAVRWMEMARSASETAIKPRLVLIRYYIDTGDKTTAKQIANEAVKAAPKRIDTWNALGAAQMQAGEYRSAIRSFSEAIELQPESELVLLNLARAQFVSEDNLSARKTLGTLIGLNPENKQAMSMLAITEMRLGNTDTALSIARQLQETGKESYALLLEGDLLTMANRPGEAIKPYETVAKLSPSATVMVKLYSALKAAGTEHPENTLVHWLEKHPGDTSIRIILAGDYAVRSETAKAIGEYEKIAQAEPDNRIALNNLAWLYSRTNDPRAVETAQRAHKLAPDDGPTTDTLGWILVQNGQHARAVKLLETASNQSPDLLTIRYHYAVALAGSGEREKARRIMEKLMASGQEFPEIGDARKFMETL